MSEENYGYLWWVGDDLFGHDWFDSGWYGHFLLAVPELRLVIAVSSEDGVSDQFQEIQLPVVDEVLVKAFRALTVPSGSACRIDLASTFMGGSQPAMRRPSPAETTPMVSAAAPPRSGTGVDWAGRDLGR